MGSVEFGARQAVQNCMKIQPNERVLIITDHATYEIAQLVKHEIEVISPGNVIILWMEDFGPRPDAPDAVVQSLKFPAMLTQEFQKADVSFYMAAGKKGELQSFRIPMFHAIHTNPRLRHAHMPNITVQLMETGMSVDYAAVQRLSAAVYEICHRAKKIHVSTAAGTDFTAYFNPEWRWIISDGNIKPGEWSNLPDGEVFTCVGHIPEGTLVVDGILGDFFSEKYGLLKENPLIVQIKNSRISNLDCKRKDLLQEFQERTELDEHANRIGEFAIGTNIGLTEFVGNLLQDEKFPGVHVAFGHGYPEKTGSNWYSDGHIDAVLAKTNIVIDGQEIMRDGHFLIQF